MKKTVNRMPSKNNMPDKMSVMRDAPCKVSRTRFGFGNGLNVLYYMGFKVARMRLKGQNKQTQAMDKTGHIAA